MRQFAAILTICATVLMLLTTGCWEKSEKQIKQDEIERVQLLHGEAILAIYNIQYIRDTRTNICFAYYWGGDRTGGPALACVPCEKIPFQLLIIEGGK